MTFVFIAAEVIAPARVTRRGAGEPGVWQLVDTDAGRGLERFGHEVVLLADLGAPPLQEDLPDCVGPGVAYCVGELPTHLVARVADGATTVVLRDMTAGEHTLTWLVDGRDLAPTLAREERFFGGGDEHLVPPIGASYVVIRRPGL